MKIKPEQYQHMLIAMRAAQTLQSTATRAYYEDYYGAKGLAAKHQAAERHRWDLCRAAGLMTWICDNVYAYADDTHIDFFVYVLISIHVYNGHLTKEYQSTFSTQGTCNAVMREMNAATVGRPWYCEKHIVE